MELFGENQIYAYILGILLTVVALIFSTKYTLSNIKRIWDAGKPKPTIADENDQKHAQEISMDDLAGRVLTIIINKALPSEQTHIITP